MGEGVIAHPLGVNAGTTTVPPLNFNEAIKGAMTLGGKKCLTLKLEKGSPLRAPLASQSSRVLVGDFVKKKKKEKKRGGMGWGWGGWLALRFSH